MAQYINNLTTGKIELHFSKPEYLALSDTQKSELKSRYLFNGKLKAWVSRSINNHFYALQVANKLGFTEEVKVGERLSYAEQLTIKSEKAEERAERMETHAENATARANQLQSAFNKCREDWSWLTQPNINSSCGRAFTKQRDKITARFERGFDELNKADYYKRRAAAAKATANNEKLKDKIYLHNRIKECKANMTRIQKSIISNGEQLNKIQHGETVKNWRGEVLTANQFEDWIDGLFNNYEWEQDKLHFLEDKFEESGGNMFSAENVKAGYIVNMKRWGKCEILSAGPVNVNYKILTGGAAGMCGTEPYAAIVEILTATEAPKLENPFSVGEIVGSYSVSGNSLIKAYQIVKVTKTGCKIQAIKIADNKPVANEFTGEAAVQKKVTKSRYSNFVGLYDGGWQLQKINVA